MSSYGLIVMVLGFCVIGSTAAFHIEDAGLSPQVQIPIFSLNINFWAHRIVVTNS